LYLKEASLFVEARERRAKKGTERQAADKHSTYSYAPISQQ
jgi:hypothetical protein